MWTDYTPVPLEVAGAINVPVAMFGYPLYHLLHDGTKTWEVLSLLFGVAVQWAYVGFVLDTRNTHTERTRFRRIAGAIGFLFGVFVLLVTIPMHHVAAIYKGGAALWSLVICLHFIKVSRNQPSVPQSMS
jgi:Zn-dependent protease